MGAGKGYRHVECTTAIPEVAQKDYSMAAGQKGFSFCATKCFISASVAQKDRALDRPRRRQKASGRVVTCPEGWIALKRKPRNRALFALCCIWPICKIEAGSRRVWVGKKCSANDMSDCMA